MRGSCWGDKLALGDGSGLWLLLDCDWVGSQVSEVSRSSVGYVNTERITTLKGTPTVY